MKAHIPEMQEPYVPMKKMREWVKANEHLDDEEKLTLSFILTLCFPQVWTNIQEYARKCWEEGFQVGKEVASSEDKDAT